MKSSSIIIIFMISAVFSVSFANDCRIIEYPDKIEVICIGESQKNISQNKNIITTKEYRPYQPETNGVAVENQKTTINSCKMLRADHYDAARNPNVEIEVVCDATGRSSEYLEFLLYGLSQENERLLTTVMSGYLGSDGSGSIKNTFVAEYSKFINAYKWEPDRKGTTILISQNYLFNEKDTLNRIYQLKQETADQLAQNVGTGFIGENILLKKGVTFNHARHQRNNSCRLCHQSASVGRISGFGKDWAHKNCKECHSEKRQGPTNCKGCHTK